MPESITHRNPAGEPMLNAAKIIDAEVEVSWMKGAPAGLFSPMWLRDHCHAKHSLNPDTLQRQVDTFAIPEDIVPAKLEIADGGRSLRIVWRHDGSTSTLPPAFLWEIARSDGRDTAPPRWLWGRAALAGQFPTVGHDEILSSNEGLR